MEITEQKRKELERKKKEEIRRARYQKLYDRYDDGENTKNYDNDARGRLLINAIHTFNYKFNAKKQIPNSLKYSFFIVYCHKNHLPYLINEEDYKFIMNDLGYLTK
jgi:hypothetical protein